MGITSQSAMLNTDYDATTKQVWKIPNWESLSDEQKRFSARQMQTYAGMLDNMDENIGRLFSYLKEIGEYDNTLVIFMSDNGADPNALPLNPNFTPWYKEKYDLTFMEDYNGDYSKMGQKGSYADYGPGWAAASNTPNSYYKMFSTEGGIRVPFIASFPGHIPQGKHSNAFAFVKDITPTLMEVAGVEYQGDTYQGKTIKSNYRYQHVEVVKGRVRQGTSRIGKGWI